MNTLQDVVTRVVEDHVFILTERIEQQWAAMDGGIFTAHEVSIRRFTPSKNMVRLGLDFDGLGFYILEYGSGSLMVTSSAEDIGSMGNPFVDDYMNSSLYNNLRSANGNAITGRSKGETVHSPTEGKDSYKSEGRLKGKNLEKRLGDKSKLEPLVPQMPLHIVETEVMHWLQEIEPAIDEAVEAWLDEQIMGSLKGNNR